MRLYLLARCKGASGKTFSAAGDSEAQVRAAKLRKRFGAAAKLYRRDPQGWVPVAASATLTSSHTQHGKPDHKQARPRAQKGARNGT